MEFEGVGQKTKKVYFYVGRLSLFHQSVSHSDITMSKERNAASVEKKLQISMPTRV